ncbi:MAG: hydrogenase accessory protein HypB [Candidatus Aquicultor secundus]|uniref:Hydrogenase accessory protein HypB n=1 Tax=Candidatus Aquicultor secundus TaxID=1973895 RepID=A0A2M7TB05_9ACTN|nr:hydrogenase nickel incorporation protein HypB [Candidatus Aquicultor secundus]NCO65447.1 hydrogenase nickel incorporation protein HypB [Solirubrobacter sp.]OIO84608.1 MAG: hydrogenase accessory protein HypB [Candidatus Aquicultor secundus]PIU26965.1 MAG: hydrogenase accessory protein HypB [Candidatus Aquicultor secundus]PIW21279.1 MAG: hydrogenase accessory protein HypB [Candidatus Aquicultor secundus]PIX52390.1 MAG: hydrogenase accessory protein HypB [Candidatus Aquicultor secundus]
MEIKVLESIFAANENLADKNAEVFKEKGIFAINLMSSPGAGKTSFILETARRLSGHHKAAVIEGDIASKVDAEKVREHGIETVQINTGGACHLEANMIQKSLEYLDLTGVDLLIIENVGNLVCPADFVLGESARVVILSVPEGDDKPLKYPTIFSSCEVLIINKIDMLALSDFSMERLEDTVRKLNPNVNVIPLSCRTGEGFDAWMGWLEDKLSGALGL